ncbi:thiosulfate oxidation carrier protein SoxY [Roseospira visakhapatnamensis]|uniref:Sulfur-oxidizing protein SoxY n=1 Tax=Roseospira visakhapatnamensis TaxID=390880 RepID=A0A7W6RBZ2_9PROT|nr:thiosulfate oxidation carrier protein SoxY [Roseospira visakhapatnamensis]MBB4265706.1 sulfur-oxidizing protein SoxY [Roseospira visakhapatnamensis]
MKDELETGGVSRRTLMVSLGGGAAVTTAMTLVPGLSLAGEAEVQAIIDQMAEGTPVDGGVELDLPEIAENGNTVPVTVTVDAPMTADSYVKTVMVMADGNPQAEVARFNFTPACGTASASTRMRLAGTQTIIAAAQMNDGSTMVGRKLVKVTIGGCGG